MLLYIVKFSFISLLIIILTHYLYKYFTSLLTTPKVKDLVFVPTKKYDELYELIKQDKQDIKAQAPENPIKSNLDMKSELKKYLNTQLSNIQQTNNIKQYNTSKLIYTDIKHT
jgi:hypothetical protein